MKCYGENKSFVLEKELTSGGEGSIWTIYGCDDRVAKIYNQIKLQSDPLLEEKICYMVKNPPSSSILNMIAWPIEVLRDSKNGFLGFIMPKLDTHTDLRSIYPYPPSEKMPITYEQRVVIAINICIVISGVHEAGYVFGDFNPMNIGINLKNGHVAFFDVDSYHFTDKKTGKEYRCGVGYDGYVAPELIQRVHDFGPGYLDTPSPTFTKETDRFALAIHIFKLLMNGYTPFNGIKESESASTSMPGTGNIAIERDNYCFKAGNKPQSCATPELDSLSPEIQFLLKKTFIGGNTNPSDRATAEEWKKALIDYKSKLVVCKNNSKHFYFGSNHKCPYCLADERYRKSLIGITNKYTSGASGSANSSQLSFSTPIAVPTQTRSHAAPAYNTNMQYSNKKKFGWIGIIGLIFKLVFGLLFLPFILASYFKRKRTVGCLAWPCVIVVGVGWLAIVISIVEPFYREKETVKNNNQPNITVNNQEIDEPPVKPLGLEPLNLKEYECYDSICVDSDIASDFGTGSKSWDNSLRFRAGNGYRSAYASYSIKGKFETLSFELRPYNYSSYFNNYCSAELLIINLDTNAIIHRQSIEGGALPVDVLVDISNIDKFQIMVQVTNGMLAYCVLSDIYVTPPELVGKITKSGVSIYSEMSLQSNVLITPEANSVFSLSGICEYDSENNLWYEVFTTETKEEKGWVRGEDFELVEKQVEKVLSETELYGSDYKNLRLEKPYDEASIDIEVSHSFLAEDRIWPNAMLFRPNWANPVAYGVYELNEEFTKLSFIALPYIYDQTFMTSSEACVEIINMETEEVLSSTRITYDTESELVNVDITGVKYLKIGVKNINGMVSQCVLSDVYVYN